ncbi:MAG: acetate--CoA ligase family protein [Rhizobiaceae bacterium]
MKGELDRLLNPRSIVVIGGKEAERVVEQCDKFGFEGTIWPVHPTRQEMHGRPCLRSLDELPEAPDAAYIAVNRETSVDMVRQLAAMGAGGAVCYAAGFAEADGEKAGSGDLQRQLVEAAGDMPILGPNCYGLINALEGVALWPDQHGASRCDGTLAAGVAIIAQSSNIAINLTMQRRGLPIAAVMTVGNQAQQGLSKLGLAWLEDERITAVGLYVEGLDDVNAFEKLAQRARELRKPVIILKVGRSAQARTAALTHTASLAGSDTAHDALFDRLGIARVDTLEAFLETLKLLHVGGVTAGNEILSLSCSGGEASLMADAAAGRGVTYRPFTGGQAGQLKQVLGDLVTIANPLDYNTFIWGDWAAMEDMFTRALSPQFDLAILVNDYPRGDRCDDADWANALETFIKAVKTTGARAANVASLAEAMPEDYAQRLIENGIAPLCGLDNAILAAEAAAKIAATWEASSPPALLPARASAIETVVLDEQQSKAELAVAGLIVPKSVVVEDMADLENAFAELEFPLAIKILGIAHKTELGAVELNLNTTADAVMALQRLARHGDRFLVEEMAARPLAELLVGVSRDPVCGLLLTIGAGGVLTELLDDTASLLLPVTETDIREALSSLKIGQMLDGFRDSDAADIDALIANILCIANYAANHADTLEELDVNPLFASQFGSVAVDALIVKRKPNDR